MKLNFTINENMDSSSNRNYVTLVLKNENSDSYDPNLEITRNAIMFTTESRLRKRFSNKLVKEEMNYMKNIADDSYSISIYNDDNSAGNLLATEIIDSIYSTNPGYQSTINKYFEKNFSTRDALVYELLTTMIKFKQLSSADLDKILKRIETIHNCQDSQSLRQGLSVELLGPKKGSLFFYGYIRETSKKVEVSLPDSIQQVAEGFTFSKGGAS